MQDTQSQKNETNSQGHEKLVQTAHHEMNETESRRNHSDMNRTEDGKVHHNFTRNSSRSNHHDGNFTNSSLSQVGQTNSRRFNRSEDGGLKDKKATKLDVWNRNATMNNSTMTPTQVG